jgi:hypothetical protein
MASTALKGGMLRVGQQDFEGAKLQPTTWRVAVSAVLEPLGIHRRCGLDFDPPGLSWIRRLCVNREE